MATRCNAVTGCAGEHYVAYRLSSMGYLVAITRVGSPCIDLMVGTPDGKKTVTIQVKTAHSAFIRPTKKHPFNCWYWSVGRKAKELVGKSVFYAFVDLKTGKPDKSATCIKPLMPDVFIVPADIVATSKPANDRKGLSGLNVYKADSRPPMFFFNIMEKDKEKWGEAWHLIEDALESKARAHVRKRRQA